MSEQLTNWERQNNGYISARSPEDARHPHTIKESNHPDVIVERVEELERQVRLLIAGMPFADNNDPLEYGKSVLETHRKHKEYLESQLKIVKGI